MENLTFETKCRRCNTLIKTDTEKPIGTANFQCLMNIYIRHAPLLPCPKCGIFTIQDIVSHTRVILNTEPELTKEQTDLINRCNENRTI